MKDSAPPPTGWAVGKQLYKYSYNRRLLIPLLNFCATLSASEKVAVYCQADSKNIPKKACFLFIFLASADSVHQIIYYYSAFCSTDNAFTSSHAMNRKTITAVTVATPKVATARLSSKPAINSSKATGTRIINVPSSQPTKRLMVAVI